MNKTDPPRIGFTIDLPPPKWPIWGDGSQSRNFTYVEDIVSGLVLACEHIEDGRAVNAGISDFISLKEAAEEVFNIIGWRPPEGVKYLADKPVGVKHRAADTSYAKETTGWEPKYTFKQGLTEAIKWYVANNDPEKVKENLKSLLMDR